jgi:hypothetical protein
MKLIKIVIIHCVTQSIVTIWMLLVFFVADISLKCNNNNGLVCLTQRIRQILLMKIVTLYCVCVVVYAQFGMWINN